MCDDSMGRQRRPQRRQRQGQVDLLPDNVKQGSEGMMRCKKWFDVCDEYVARDFDDDTDDDGDAEDT